MLILTTIRRLALLLFLSLVWAPAAYAWSWPVQGPVVQPFSYDESHPYAAGQHRGVDIGAEAAGETVVAPAAGIVSFAGSVAANGRTVTIETADGYSVTLTHLGSIDVAKGATVAEQQTVGTVGPSGTPEVDGPYVHLGIRRWSDPNGYVDPVGLLPAPPDAGPTPTGSTGTQPSSSGAASAPPSKKPAASAPSTAHTAIGRARAARGRGLSSREQGRVQVSQTDARSYRSSQQPTSRDARTPLESRTHRSRPSEGPASLRRPIDEPAVLDAAPRLGPSAPLARPRNPVSDSLSGFVCNGAAAVFALGLALAAIRLRRREHAVAAAGGQLLHLGPSGVEHRRVSRAA